MRTSVVYACDSESLESSDQYGTKMLKFGAIFPVSFRRFVLAMFLSTGLISSCLWLGLLFWRLPMQYKATMNLAKKARGEAIRIRKTFLINFNISISNKYVLYLYMTLYSMYIPEKSSRDAAVSDVYL